MAMGITPYINASIIMQLLTVAIPKLEETAASRARKAARRSRRSPAMSPLALGFIQAVALTVGLSGAWHAAAPWALITIGFCLAAGTALAMWIGERITENGIGNGISRC